MAERRTVGPATEALLALGLLGATAGGCVFTGGSQQPTPHTERVGSRPPASAPRKAGNANRNSPTAPQTLPHDTAPGETAAIHINDILSPKLQENIELLTFYAKMRANIGSDVRVLLADYSYEKLRGAKERITAVATREYCNQNPSVQRKDVEAVLEGYFDSLKNTNGKERGLLSDLNRRGLTAGSSDLADHVIEALRRYQEIPVEERDENSKQQARVATRALYDEYGVRLDHQLPDGGTAEIENALDGTLTCFGTLTNAQSSQINRIFDHNANQGKSR